MILTLALQVNFGRDVEKQLNFYSECRSSFVNLDAVKSYLAKCVCSLAVTTLKIVKGKHTKETSSFVRVSIRRCLALNKSLLILTIGLHCLCIHLNPFTRRCFRAVVFVHVGWTSCFGYVERVLFIKHVSNIRFS